MNDACQSTRKKLNNARQADTARERGCNKTGRANPARFAAAPSKMARLPSADDGFRSRYGLTRHIQPLGGLLLRHSPALPERAKIFSQVHLRSPHAKHRKAERFSSSRDLLRGGFSALIRAGRFLRPRPGLHKAAGGFHHVLAAFQLEREAGLRPGLHLHPALVLRLRVKRGDARHVEV